MKIMKILSFLGAMAFFGVCALLTAQMNQAQQNPPPPPMLHELTGSAQAFGLRAEGQTPVSPRRSRGPRPLMSSRMAGEYAYFYLLDANEDGRVDAEEAADDPQWLADHDLDGDGVVTWSEFRQAAFSRTLPDRDDEIEDEDVREP